jgi:hypothetical protein
MKKELSSSDPTKLPSAAVNESGGRKMSKDLAVMTLQPKWLRLIDSGCAQNIE